MKYEEIKGDLFSAGDEYYYVQCGSADLALGAGIALQFNERFGVKDALRKKFKDNELLSAYKQYGGFCVGHLNTMTLITKYRYYDKPTYQTLTDALIMLKKKCEYDGINKLAMPKIGCGLDRLNFDRVSGIIKAIFEDTDIEIKVFYL